MAGVALTLNVSKADTARFAKLISRAQNELGKSPFDAVNWAGYFITRSMAAATKVAPKLRRIVANPDFKQAKASVKRKMKNDPNFARYGVFAYNKKDEKTFVPIIEPEYRRMFTFTSKTTGEILIKDLNTGEVHRLQGKSKAEQITPGISKDKRRIITRSGLAKKAWTWARGNTRKGGSTSIDGAKSAMAISWSGGKSNPTLKIYDNLHYASDAFKKGESGVENVMSKAGDALANRIDAALGKVIK